jgi:hypothetical protein
VGDARVRWLLGLALLLGVLRFAIVPWTQQQVEQRQQLEVLTQRLDRSSSVVRNAEAILAAQSKVAAVSDAARAPYPVVPDRDQFRLEAQRMLATIAGRRGVTVSLFEWVLDGEAPDAGMAYGRVNASLTGPLESLVAVHGLIEVEMPFAAVREAKVGFGRMSEPGLSKEVHSLVLVLDLYYRPSAAVPRAAGEAP